MLSRAVPRCDRRQAVKAQPHPVGAQWPRAAGGCSPRGVSPWRSEACMILSPGRRRAADPADRASSTLGTRAPRMVQPNGHWRPALATVLVVIRSLEGAFKVCLLGSVIVRGDRPLHSLARGTDPPSSSNRPSYPPGEPGWGWSARRVRRRRSRSWIAWREIPARPRSRLCPTTSWRSRSWRATWRGLRRLMDVHLGFASSNRVVGN
jgi:hypothetical protein